MNNKDEKHLQNQLPEGNISDPKNNQGISSEKNAGKIGKDDQFSDAPQPKNKHKDDKPPVKRVGTLTMGVALILTGVLLVYSLFASKLDIIFIAKLTPIIFILLGLEILISSVIYKDKKLKYDFFSGFICFLLVLSCLGVLGLSEAYQFYGPEREIMENAHSKQVYDACYQILQADSNIGSLDTSFHINSFYYDENMDYHGTDPAAYINLHINFIKNFANKEEFAAACADILNVLPQTKIEFDDMHFESSNSSGESAFSLSLCDKFQYKMSAASLVKLVN